MHIQSHTHARVKSIIDCIHAQMCSTGGCAEGAIMSSQIVLEQHSIKHQDIRKYAHDFNNVLTVVLCSTRSIRRHLNSFEASVKQEILNNIELIESASNKGVQIVKGIASLEDVYKE